MAVLENLKPERVFYYFEDTGIGMTNEELEKNLGTIAKSGSADFKEQLEKRRKQ